jgi:hypothetical protein
MGTVTKSAVIEDRSGRGVAHYPSVAYAYEVDGTKLVGHRIHARDVSEAEGQAKRTISAYPIGATIRTYYNPSDPSESMLAPGRYWYTWAWLALSLVAVLIGSAGVYFYRPVDRSLVPPNKSLERTREG